MAIQLSEALTALSDQLGDIGDVTTRQFVRWCDFARSRVYRLVAQIDSERFMKEETFSNVSDGEFSLPSDFRDVKAPDAGFYLYENGQYGGELTNIPFNSEMVGYFLRKNTVRFTGLENETIVLRYVPKLTAISDISAYLTVDGTETGDEVIPEEYLEALVEDLKRLFLAYDENPNEGASEQRFARLLAEMSATFERDIKIIY